MKDFLEPFKEEMKKAKTIFDRHMFMWCVENYVPLKQFKEGEILVLFYEDLCRQPEQEIKKIFSYIGEDFTSSILESSAKPSALSLSDSAINSKGDPLNSWRKNISAAQIQRAVEILSIFGLQKIYNRSSLPLVNATEALNLFSARSEGLP